MVIQTQQPRLANLPPRPSLVCPNCKSKSIKQLPFANCECQNCRLRGGYHIFVVPRVPKSQQSSS